MCCLTSVFRRFCRHTLWVSPCVPSPVNGGRRWFSFHTQYVGSGCLVCQAPFLPPCRAHRFHLGRLLRFVSVASLRRSAWMSVLSEWSSLSIFPCDMSIQVFGLLFFFNWTGWSFSRDKPLRHVRNNSLHSIFSMRCTQSSSESPGQAGGTPFLSSLAGHCLLLLCMLPIHPAVEKSQAVCYVTEPTNQKQKASPAQDTH